MPVTNRRTGDVIVEALNPNLGFCYSIDKVLYRGKTRYQKMELVHSPEFGVTLLLDGITQVAESNDYQYHEPMVHPAMCAHDNPRSVLVIGGGDGGILREVLRYRGVESVHLAELDGGVVDFSKKYLPNIHAGAFDDPRVELHITDGRAFVEKQRRRFDVVIMDMTDPFGPSRMLYTREFFGAVKRSLRDGRGIFVMHSESPVTRPVAFNCIRTTLGTRFKYSTVIYPYIQMYATLWSISISSDETDLSSMSAARIDRRLKGRGITGLKFVTGDSVRAMQVGFPFIDEVLKKKTRVITDTQPDFPDNFIAVTA